MKKVALLIVFLAACTDDDKTINTLRDQGFSNIHTTGWAHICSKHDSTCTGFSATNVNGRVVTGAVGCGRGFNFRGCTIRYDE